MHEWYRGFFGRGDMQKEFEQAAFDLKPGQVSEVVDTASGVHLIQRCVVCRKRLSALLAHMNTDWSKTYGCEASCTSEWHY